VPQCAPRPHQSRNTDGQTWRCALLLPAGLLKRLLSLFGSPCRPWRTTAGASASAGAECDGVVPPLELRESTGDKTTRGLYRDRLIVPLDVARRLARPLLRRPLLLPTVHRVAACVTAPLLDVPPGVAAGLPRGPGIVAILTPILTSFRACRLRGDRPRREERSGDEERQSESAHAKSRPCHVMLPSSDGPCVAAQGKQAALLDWDRRLTAVPQRHRWRVAVAAGPDVRGFSAAAVAAASQDAVAGRMYKSTPHACQASIGLEA